jgi:hypothetical protein
MEQQLLAKSNFPFLSLVGAFLVANKTTNSFSIGLGGGSRVRQSDDDGKRVTVGPDSVALRLTTDAMVFGGKVMTASDIVVASGAAVVGQPEKVKGIIPEDLIKAAKADIKRQVERAIDNMKVSSAPVSVLLVGGGSIILTEDLDPVAECLRPPHHDSANAVGAAIAKVAGEIDVIEVLAGRDEDAAIEEAKRAATNAAISSGADESTIQIAELKKIPLQYVTNKATRFVIKAVGNLRVKEGAAASDRASQQNGSIVNGDSTEEDVEAAAVEEEVEKAEVTKVEDGSMAKPALGVDLTKYRPKVENGIWHISPVDVELISSGCGVLGTGGGGSSYLMALYTLNLLRQGAEIRVMRPEDLKDSDICVFGAGYGAPSVSDERISSGTDVFTAIEAVNTIMGITDFQAIVTDEIGGGNGLVTMPSSARYNRPIVDCDLMGRAYPTLEHGKLPFPFRFSERDHTDPSTILSPTALLLLRLVLPTGYNLLTIDRNSLCLWFPRIAVSCLNPLLEPCRTPGRATVEAFNRISMAPDLIMALRRSGLAPCIPTSASLFVSPILNHGDRR